MIICRFWPSPAPLRPAVFALLATASLSLQAQTLIHYRLNDVDAAAVASGSVPNLGTLGAGITGVVGSNITLSVDIPTTGVPPGLGNRSINGGGKGGIRAPGTRQLHKTNIFNAGGFTYEAWFKWDENGTNNNIIDYAGTEQLSRSKTDIGPRMRTSDGAKITVLGAAPANEWHYAAAVFTPIGPVSVSGSITGNFAFYLNTNAPTSYSSNVVISGFGDSLNRTIGVAMHPEGFAGNYFSGLIYSPRVSLGALPADALLFKRIVVVNNANDSGAGSFRNAVATAPDLAVITFTPNLSGTTIRLASEIVLSNNVTIDASSLSGGVTLSGNNATRIFTVSSGKSVSLIDLTLAGGNGTGALDSSFGGAIINHGSLTLARCTLTGNSAGTQGGAIEARGGTLILTNCTLNGNSATYGGAICSPSGSTVRLIHCTVAGNSASGGGGAIDNYNSSPLTLTNCILAANSDTSGTAPDLWMESGALAAANCIIGNGQNSTLANGVNGNQVGTTISPINPLLSPLGNYSGPTKTMPPLPGSPAIDAASVVAGLTTDQRGSARNVGIAPDIGAVESGGLWVQNINNTGANSLRYVLTNTANATNQRAILFATNLSGATITLASELVLASSVTIDASALANGIRIDGNGASRIFTVETGQRAVMNALTLTNGNGDDKAGGIYCKGSLTMNQCTLAGNVATNAGLGWGGAILVEGLASTTLNRCTLSGNRAVTGGAIYSVQTSSLMLNQCTVAGNIATTAGAISSPSAQLLAINQSTICSNSTTSASATIFASAITKSITNSVVFGLNNDPDIEVAAIEGFRPNVSHNLVGVNPLLAPLGNYGGRTQTMPPLPGSPANNDGDDSITNSFATDQRGFPRAIGFHVDIGAAEATNAPFTPSALTLPGSIITFTSATLNGSVGIGGTNTSYYFQYGLTTNYGSFSATNSAIYSGAVGTTVTGLSLSNAPNNNYHFRLVATNAQGVALGNDVLLTGVELRTWIPLANQLPESAGHPQLMSDGTVLVMHTNNWYRLAPDATGSYANGTWSTVASSADDRYFFASQVLRDGRLFVAGGEYGSGGNKSEIYDPVANTWTQIPVPTNLSVNISDASSMLLPDGRVLVAPVSPATNNLTIIFDPASNTWSSAGATLGGQNESNWGELPDGSILTIDFLSTNTERYIPSLGRWISDAPTPVFMSSRYGAELGPGIMLPNGKAIYFGDHGKNAIYTPSGNTNVGSWVNAPDFPNGQGMPDAPAAMLVNGKLLCVTAAAPDVNEAFHTPTSFFEYDYVSNTFTGVSAPGGTAVFDGPCYPFRMVCLPDGTVLCNPDGLALYVYRPEGALMTNGQPNIQAISSNPDGSLHLSGTQFNGLSAGASYGDDEQFDSNFPLVRFTDGNGIVRYGRTYNWSSTGVQTGTNVVTTEATIPAGASLQDKVEVIANGIASPQLSYPIALDNTSLTWTATGNTIWGVQTIAFHDGVDAARSGPLTNSQSSSLTTTVSGPGVLTFWWRVSSETNFDFVRFTVDGVEQPAAPGISGEVNWQQRIVTIPAGTHTLTWSYSKDGSLSAGLDAGWLDQVAFGSTLIATTNDSGLGSLREAVANLPSGNTVTFAANLSGQTIGLSGGQLTFSNNITIDASALTNRLTLSGLNSNRVLIINPGVTSVLSGLTITGGNGAGAAPVANYGGAIFNQGNLTLSNCYVVANSGFAGGAIFNSSGNRLTLHASTLATNSASYGGAVQNEGTLLADNTTFTGNSGSTEGGAISAPFSSPVGLLQCTMSGNNAGDGGGIIGVNVALTNSIIAGNTATTNPNLSGSFTTGGNNLTTGSPLLDTLANYGGPTPTMRPLIGSPAIDTGGDTVAFGLSFDQRGRSRTSGIHVDLGAVEVTTNSVVTTVADSGPGSLRTVVTNIEPGFTVTFANAISGQTIALTSGQIVLDKNFTLDGTGSSIQISGNNLSRIFFVNSGVNATLNGLTLINGLASQGGAIQNLGSLTLNECTLAGNQDNCACGINGGAVLNRGSLAANNSTFNGNRARFGGAIFNDTSSTLAVNQSTFNGNVGTNGGGAIYNFNATMTVKQSTVVGNQSPGGGAQGGGINNSGFGFFLTNSIVCNNTASSSPNIAGVVTPFSSPNNLVDTNPLLGTLGNNGGPTQTMPPLTGSPALNAGNDVVAASFVTDQRGIGFPRLSGAHVDIGAVEFQYVVATNPPLLTGITRLGNGNLKFSFTNLSGASFTVFASTNVALPLNAWSNLGSAVETPASSGQFQFIDTQATNFPSRFYRVKSP